MSPGSGECAGVTGERRLGAVVDVPMGYPATGVLNSPSELVVLVHEGVVGLECGGSCGWCI